MSDGISNTDDMVSFSYGACIARGIVIFCRDMTRDLDLDCDRGARYSSITGKVIQTEVVVVIVSMVVMLQRNTVAVYRSRISAPITSGVSVDLLYNIKCVVQNRLSVLGSV